MANIRFNYLYRDAADFKLFGSVVFSNLYRLAIPELKVRVESKLIDGKYFDPDEWGLPRLHLEDFDDELDHGWCEFDGVEVTRDTANFGKVGDWLRRIEKGFAMRPGITIYLKTDQPTTCPFCGARTETLADFRHTNLAVEVERCLHPHCEFTFLLGEDDE